MTALPTGNYVTDPARTVAEIKQAQRDMLGVIAELLGGAAEGTLAIAAGAVTPTAAVHSIDTEGGAATDDLTNIATTNHPDGRLLVIRCANNARSVVVKHNAGGAGQIALAAAADLTLKDTTQWLILKRSGANWEEILHTIKYGAIAVENIGQGLEDDGAGNLRVKLDTAKGGVTRSANGLAVDPLFMRGYLFGGTLSNNAVSPNTKIDVTTLSCVAADLSGFITVAGGTIDFGTVGANGLDAGAPAINTWYHCFGIGKPDGTGALIASTNLAPALPSGYTRYRRLGSVKTDGSGHLISFIQVGDYFYWTSPSADDVNASLGATPTNFTVNCPPGIQTLVHWQASAVETSSNSSGSVRIYNPSLSDFAVQSGSDGSASFGFVSNASATAIQRLQANGWTLTNTAQQIRAVASITTTFAFRVVGWRDFLGRV